MKYLSILSLLAFSACSSGTQSKTYICMSAITPLGGIAADTADPNVKEVSASLEITTPQGAKVIVPKSLCVQVVGNLQ